MRARVFLIVAVLALLTGCAPAASPPAAERFGSFAEVLDAARGQTVNFYAYGGDDGANSYIDDVLAPRAREIGVTVRRIPIDDTETALRKLLGDKQAGRTTGGAIDLLWVNGENFRTGKQAGVWDCGWTELLPNARYVDGGDPEIASDFGTPVDGCESPWLRSQFALVYDSAKVRTPPRSTAALLDWIRANPGRFSYPAPPDFTGSVFVRQLLYASAGGYQRIPREHSGDAEQRITPKLWSTLRDIAPKLWRGGATYPPSSARLNQLYADGEVDFTMTYGPAEVDALVARGVYPKTTRAYTLDEGTIGNTAFLAVPANAEHKAAALAVANLELSPAQQLAKARPRPWGAYPAIDVARTEPRWRRAFAALPESPHVPPFAELTRNSQPELRASWTAPLDEGWRREVLAR